MLLRVDFTGTTVLECEMFEPWLYADLNPLVYAQLAAAIVRRTRMSAPPQIGVDPEHCLPWKVLHHVGLHFGPKRLQ